MKKLSNIACLSLLVCTGLLLNIAAAANEQNAPPRAETSKYDLPEINESNIQNNRTVFVVKALGDGEVIKSTNAEAYFVGSSKSRNCLTLTGVIACRITGPVKALLVYKDDEKFFEIGKSEIAICYIGPRGIFCDGDEYRNAEGGSNQPAGEIAVDPFRRDYRIHVGSSQKLQGCVTGHKSMLCIALGPAQIDLTHDGLSRAAYELDMNTNAVCYAGRLGSFCDVYEKAAAGK